MAGYSKTEEKAYLQEKARELLSPLIESYFRDINLPAKASSYEGVYHWNNRYWEKITKSEFENKCNTILQDLNLNTAIQKKVLHEFILSLGKKESELNRFGEHLFCIESGVLAFSHLIEENSEIDQLLKENVSEIQKINAKNVTIWSIPHSLCKKFYITQYSDLVFKDSPDDEAITKFSSFLEKSIVSFKDYSEFIFNLINSFFCGDDSGSFFVNFLGKTQCGKTTFVNFLTELLGGYYDIMGKNELKYESTEYSYDLYRKRNARLLTYSEPTSNPINATLIKEITGKTKFKFNDTGYYIRGRLLIDSNYPLACTDKSDNAFYERYVMVPFGPTIPMEERNKALLKELTSYKNDIFSYIIMKLSDICLSETILPCREKDHLLLLSNPVKFFYEEKCCKSILSFSISMSQLFNHYRKDFIQWYSNHISNIDYLNDHSEMILKASSITRKAFEQAMIYFHPDRTFDINNDSITLLGIVFLEHGMLDDNKIQIHQYYLQEFNNKLERLLRDDDQNPDDVLKFCNLEQKASLMWSLFVKNTFKNTSKSNIRTNETQATPSRNNTDTNSVPESKPISTDQDDKHDETDNYVDGMLDDNMGQMNQNYLQEFNNKLERLLRDNNQNPDDVLKYCNLEQKASLMSNLLVQNFINNTSKSDIRTDEKQATPSGNDTDSNSVSEIKPISTDQDDKHDETDNHVDGIFIDDDMPIKEPDIPDDDDLIVVEEKTDHSHSDDYRNGYKSEAENSSLGEDELEVPQDRKPSFEPKVLKKRQKEITDEEKKIIEMHAKGMTPRQISETIEDIYGYSVNKRYISFTIDKYSTSN